MFIRCQQKKHAILSSNLLCPDVEESCRYPVAIVRLLYWKFTHDLVSPLNAFLSGLWPSGLTPKQAQLTDPLAVRI